MWRNLLVLFCVFGFLNCSESGPPKTPGPGTKGLTQAQARQRFSRLGDIHYQLFFELAKDKKAFAGKAHILFDLKTVDEDLMLDFTGGTVTSLSANNLDIPVSRYDGRAIHLPKEQLKRGRNHVVVAFTHPYSTNGAGLYRFEDPEDKRVYLYTDFEPFDANQLFPCFDQPDLKATYSVMVSAPEDWQVVTATREVEATFPKDGKKLWVFPRTKKFSTYVFSLIAGPYKVWEDRSGPVPLRLLARQSVAKYVNAHEWFTITRQGFEFFQEYFAYDYPFEKYDQILVPDFNAGAMENVAAVTFNDDRYVHRSRPTSSQRERRANVILHELAHMWFGNLVTMKWWDDLWLNESFASYMAALALSEATEFKESWLSFYLGMKQWAYWEDQLVTTHPIAVPVAGTDAAFANFDGITYGKGASVLGQLAFLIGPARFRDGVRAYFKKHAYGNARLDDFINALALAAGVDLNDWTRDWLKTAGLNTLQARYTCDNDRITSFELIQKPDTFSGRLRKHRTNVAFIQKNQKEITISEVVPVIYEGERTRVSEWNGKACPAMVYPNYGDRDYVKVVLDKASLKFARDHLAEVREPLLRAMLWSGFWDRLRDGRLKPGAYLDLVVNNLGLEGNFRTASRVAETVYGRQAHDPSLLLYLGREEAPRERLEALFWQLFTEAPGKGDFKKLWFDSYVRVARTDAARERLLALITGKATLEGFEIDQDRRWNIVQRLSRLGVVQAPELIAAEQARDSSHYGKKMALAAQVALPSGTNKRRWFERLIAPKPDMSLAELKAVMDSLYPNSQIEMRPQYAQAFYENLVGLSQERENEFLDRFSHTMVPVTCSADSVRQLDEFLKRHGNLNPVVIKNLKVARQEDERCVRIRSHAIYRVKQAQ